MIIQSFSTGKNGPFECPFAIAPGLNENPQGHITVLIGENGTRKSLALSVLMTGALDQETYNGHGYSPLAVDLAWEGRKPSRVVAVSLTPWDRFPRSWALTELSTSIPGLGYQFVYIGPRSGQGAVSTRYSEATFGAVILENCISFQERSETLSPIFERLGLIPAVGVRFAARWGAQRRSGRVTDDSAARLRTVVKQRARLVDRSLDFSQHWKRTVADFAAKIEADDTALELLVSSLNQARSPRISCWITSTGPKFSRGYKSISDWRCALYLGLFEVSGVYFSTQGATLPTDPKEALRDSDLSSGQWSWLYNLTSLCVALDDDSLVLIDEPENSLHPSWQRDFIATLSGILKSCKRCHAVVATHSALIASGVRDGMGNVRRLYLREQTSTNGSRKEKSVSEKPPSDTYGAQVDDVYRELFDLPSTRTPEFIERIDSMLALIGDAKGQRPVVPAADVQYIEAARERLPAHDPLRRILGAITESVVSERGAPQ